MSIRVKYTGTVQARFSKTLVFRDQEEYDDFKKREDDNLLCNLEPDDLREIESLESLKIAVVSK